MQQVSSPAIPSHLSERRKGINPKFLIGGTLLLIMVAMIVYATVTTGAYFLTVDEMLAQGAGAQGQRLRVNGLVVDDSEDWNAQEVTLRFSIQDEENLDGQLPIVFYGPRPDNFHRAASAIIEGEMQPNGVFKADTLLLKCPSRYEELPEEVLVESTR